MPIGKPISFEGDILRLEPDAFGFFYCKITSPEYLEHPILQRRVKTNNGIRTIAGLGTWDGWIFSEEMKNAIKYGYEFEVIRGYQFEKGNLFKDYVEKMYNLRLQFDKSHPMNLIAKLLLNSLYGRYGMKPSFTRVDLYDCSTDEGKKDLQEDIEIFGESIEDYIQIDETFLIVRNTLGNMKYNDDEDFYYGVEVNIAIASAVTSYARMYMTPFKNNSDYNLYYSDTDSIIIDKELSSDIVGNKLGQLKLEHVCDQAVFLAPKVYGLITDKGDKIIKIKGITHEVANSLEISDLERLLIKDSSREFTQEKWYKKQIEGEISIQDTLYTLKVTSNKRSPLYLYDEGIEIYSNTRPYNYDEII